MKLFVTPILLGLVLCFTHCGTSGGNAPTGTSGFGTNASNFNSSLGANISAFGAHTPGWVLIDVFPKFQEWFSFLCTGGTGPSIDEDENGWVRSLQSNQCVWSPLFRHLGTHYPSGTYVLLWEGDGNFQIDGDVDELLYTSGSAEQSGGLNRMTFEVSAANQAGNGITINLVALDSDYARNFRLIVPGGMCGKSQTELDYFSYCQTDRGGEGSCPSGQTCYDFEQIYWDRFTDSVDTMNNPKPVFHPRYLQNYQIFRAVRFMKWTRVEDTTVSDFENRVSLTEQPFTDDTRGLPYEYMIAMANVLNADAWLNVPAQASDAYVTSYAELVSDRLNSNLDVYVEYGNEHFNTLQTTPYNYMLTQANADSSVPSTDTDSIKVAKWGAKRSVEVVNLWRETFGASRTIRVLGGWNAFSDWTSAALDFNNAYESVDALAIAPYFGPDRRFVDDSAAFDALSVEQFFQEINFGNLLSSGVSIADLITQMDAQAELASNRNLDVIGYEIGHHMVSTGAAQSVVDTLSSVNYDDRMHTAFTDHLGNWRTRNFKTAFVFNVEDFWDVNGTFGLFQYQDQTREESKKYDAVADFIEANPCWWDNCSQLLPGQR